jgi:glutamate--cysteine ligase
MFFFRRGERLHLNSGQTFRSFLKDGFEGERPTRADWTQHLNSLFPEARLKSTLEIRSCDSLPRSLVSAIPALFVGLAYDTRAREAAQSLVRDWDFESVCAARAQVPVHGLDTELGGQTLRSHAERLLEIAAGGLSRRARCDAAGRDETIHLAALGQLVEAGKCPADRLLGLVAPRGELEPELLFQHARVLD